MATTTSFVIDFGSVENAYLFAALDEELNDGKTTFVKGDPVHFKVYSDVDYVIATTSGSVSNNGGGTESVEDDILSFIHGAPANTSKSIQSIDGTTWYGNNLGSLNKISINEVQASGNTEDALGVASIKYTSNFVRHTLIAPASMPNIYHIVVVIVATPGA